MAETTKRGRGRPSNAQKTEDNLKSLLELGGLEDFITQYGSNANLTEITLADLITMYRNPWSNIARIQTTSQYFANRYGIIKDVNEAYKNLPTLNYHLAWSSFEKPQKILKYEQKLYDTLDNGLNIKQVVRDALGELAEIGTVIMVNRKGKFIQFLDVTNCRVRTRVNGQWQVEIDLSTLVDDVTKDVNPIIEELPDEVTLAKYKRFKATNSDKDRYVLIKNAYVLSIRSSRNFPYGFPLTMAAWGSLVHKTLIEQVEKSVADRLIKAILVMYAKSIAPDKDGYKPPNKDLIAKYFKDLSNLIKKKDSSSGRTSTTTTDNAGTGVITLPDFFRLEQVKVDTNIFPKELYDKLEREVLSNIGVSSALIYGGGDATSYGSAQMNSEKFYRYIWAALEQIEYALNDMIKGQLPNDLSCRLYFDRTTITDKEQDITAKKDFYQQTGIWIPWAEAVLGVPYHFALGMKMYQDEVLKLQDIIQPPMNANTMASNDPKANGKKGGKPKNDKGKETDSNVKAKGNGSNSQPSPSD